MSQMKKTVCRIGCKWPFLKTWLFFKRSIISVIFIFMHFLNVTRYTLVAISWTTVLTAVDVKFPPFFKRINVSVVDNVTGNVLHFFFLPPRLTRLTVLAYVSRQKLDFEGPKCWSKLKKIFFFNTNQFFWSLHPKVPTKFIFGLF